MAIILLLTVAVIAVYFAYDIGHSRGMSDGMFAYIRELESVKREYAPTKRAGGR